MKLGEKIQLTRKKKGMSQEDLANLLNVSRQAVQKWESGSSIPELDKLVEMSNAFDISLDWLVKDVPEEEIHKTETSNEEPVDSKEEVKAKNNYYVTKVFLIIGMFLTPISIVVPIMKQFNFEHPEVIIVCTLLFAAISFALGVPTLNALKYGKMKREVIGFGIMTFFCISRIAGIIILASKDPFHPNKDYYKDRFINRTQSGALGIVMGTLLLALAIASISIYGTVTDPLFVFLYLDLFVEFLVMGQGALVFGILQLALIPQMLRIK